ncbi:hypothetical protein [Rhodococcus sp. 24CO]|uniref:hypothetical protein n=1 Tax=Rhodococcus sp. 24CO TaxID=3117460 RepID=UPI003D35018D
MAGNNSSLLQSFSGARSTRIRALLSLGMVLGVGTLTTMAAWGATATSTSGDFSAGTVNIVASSTDVTEGDNITINLSSSAMTSATAVTQSLTVRNTGTLSTSVNITAQSPVSTPPSFAAALKISAYLGGISTGSSCTGTAQKAELSLVGGGSTTTLLIAPVTLGAGASSTLCVKMTLVAGTPAGGNLPYTQLNIAGSAV